MELNDVLKSNATCRYYKKDPVADEVLAGVIDAARWAPSGGNRQPLSFVVVRARETKQALQDLYLPLWNAYVDGINAGETRVGGLPKIVSDADYFANHLVDIPVMLIVCANLADVHPTDTELGRLSVVGGASIYTGVENLLLAARQAELGAALTTLLCVTEPQVKTLLNIPAHISTAAMVTLGWPERPFPTKLRRQPLEEIVFSEQYGAALF
ncbi:MAG: nitroreductase family protein [Gammaproteobacteria bacterium]